MSVAFHALAIADIRRETPDTVSIAFTVQPDLREAYRFERLSRRVRAAHGEDADEAGFESADLVVGGTRVSVQVGLCG